MAKYGYMAKIGADTSGLQSALKDINSSLAATDREINTTNKAISAAEKAGVDSSDVRKQKEEELQEAIDKTAQKLIDLKTIEEQMNQAHENGNISTEEHREYQREISNTESRLRSYQTELRNTQEASNGLANNSDDLKNKFEDVKEAAGKVTSRLKSVASVAAGAAAAMAAAAATGMIKLSQEATESYAQYEQYIGGVQTLFGAAADTVEDYANIAYRTAQISANDYMDTVTSFSASLLQGLNGDTAKAAEVANQAIIDMSDNANKMGTDMQSIQYAYQGFAKQNYTMLDNLKLGYGGTQAEMARLINDSGVLGDSMEVTARTVNNVSFDKMIEAIHVIQQELGITGTSALEAASTIEGSAGALKAAWQNLLTGFADPDQDLGALIDNVAASAASALDNFAPRIVAALPRIKDGIAELAKELLPIASETVDQILQGLFDGLGVSVKSYIPDVKEAIDGLISSLDWFANNLGTIIDLTKGLGAAWLTWQVKGFASDVAALVASTKALGIATESATAEQLAFNAAQKANLWGLIATGVIAAGTAFSSWIDRQAEALRQEAAYRTELQETYLAITDETRAISDSVKAADEKADKLEKLVNKLKDWTDESGKVIDKEQNVAGVLQQINDLTGSNLTLMGDQIQGYKDLADSMDGYLDNLRTEAQLSYLKDSYGEAISNIEEQSQKTDEAYTRYQNKDREYQAMLKEKERLEKQAADLDTLAAASWDGMDYETQQRYMRAQEAASRLEDINDRIDKVKTERDDSFNVYGAELNKEKTYQSTIDKYEEIAGGKSSDTDAESPTKEEASRTAAQSDAAAGQEKTRELREKRQSDFDAEIEALDKAKKLHKNGLDEDENYYKKKKEIIEKYKPYLTDSESFWSAYDDVDGYYNKDTKTGKKSSEKDTRTETEKAFDAEIDSLDKQKKLHRNGLDEDKKYYAEKQKILDKYASSLPEYENYWSAYDSVQTYNSKTDDENKKQAENDKKQAETNAKSDIDALAKEYENGLIDRERFNEEYSNLQQEWAENGVDIEEYAAEKAADVRKKSAKSDFDALVKMLDNELITREEFNAQYAKLEKEWSEDSVDIHEYTSEKISEINKKELDSWEKNAESTVKSITGEFETLEKKREQLADKIAGGDLAEQVTDTKGKKRYIFADVTKRTDQIKKYMQDFKRLKSTDIPEELLNEILSMDFSERAAVIEELLNMKKSSRDAYYSDYTEYKTAQKNAAAMETEDEYNELVKTSAQAYDELYAELPQSAYESGKESANKYITGLYDGLKDYGGAAAFAAVLGNAGAVSVIDHTGSGAIPAGGTSGGTNTSFISGDTAINIVIGSEVIRKSFRELMKESRLGRSNIEG